MEKKAEEIKLEIKIDEAVANGQYVNMVVVDHNENEFVLDCIYVQPQMVRAKVCSRLITSPRHAKRLMRVLQMNISNYEKKFGTIALGEDSALTEQEKPIH